MGMTRFMAIISLKGSGTYLLSRRCSKDLYAIPCSGAWNPAVQRLPWVRLVVASFDAAADRSRRFGDRWGRGSYHHKSCLINAVFPV